MRLRCFIALPFGRAAVAAFTGAGGAAAGGSVATEVSPPHWGSFA